MTTSTTYRRFVAPLLVAVFLISALMIPPADAQPTAGTTVYLPLVPAPPPPTVFGIEMHTVTSERGLELVRTSGTRWVRRNGLLWKDVEPVEGAGYRWDHPEVQALEAELIEANRSGLKLILVIRGSPMWATKPYNADCAPINPAKIAAFLNFLKAAVLRYSSAPYNVRYWEIGNEPDAGISPSDSVFGCWGVAKDEYYGGRAYGELLRQAYPAMKQVNPEIAILNGGLLLDRPYDPNVPATLPGRFFEGMLRAGAGNAFDILSIHSYTFYRTPGLPPLGSREDWRVKYVRDLMDAYRVPQKPLIRSETALLCTEVTPECRWAQADFIARSFARSLRDGLLANIWYVYDNDSYHNTGLIDPGDVFVPRPGYFAYRHVARMLSGAKYLGPIQGLPPAVEGYWFDLKNGLVAVYWTEGETVPFQLVLPGGQRVECTARDGGSQPCTLSDGRVELTAERSPAFVRVD